MNPRKSLGARARVASADWIAIRTAFIERPERPLLSDLSVEFGVSEARISRAMSDEGWPALRAARLDQALQSSDAVKALLDAARTEGAVQRAMSNIALEVISQLHEVSAQAARAQGKAENTRANTLNTVTFALRNLAGALKDVGLVGLPKALKGQAGMADEQGRWNPAMLASLNVTVQNIVGAGSQAASGGPSGSISEAIEAEGVSAPPAALPEPAGAILEPVPERAADLV